jgi:hypothetical protein
MNSDLKDYEEFQSSVFMYSFAEDISSRTTVYLRCKTNSKAVQLYDFYIHSYNALLAFEFYENAVMPSAGTPQTVVNRNRISDTQPTLEVCYFYENPKIPSEDKPQMVVNRDSINDTQQTTLLLTDRIVGANANIINDDLIGKWLLKPNTEYFFKIFNETYRGITVAAGFNWLELNNS